MNPPKSTEKLTVSAPGRICLFGEHQDYLGLPVIPAAINLRLVITGERRPDKIFKVRLPDIDSEDEFSSEGEIPYILERDYLRSGVNVLKRDGVGFNYGYDCLVRGEIPINSGTSSSSALCVAWVKFLWTIADDPRQDDAEKIGNLAYLAEVEEFGEPGGMMDQNASALGKVICVDFKPEFRITRMPSQFGTFVLGDSLQEKDTRKTLARIKSGTFSVVEKVKKRMPGFSLNETPLDEILSLLPALPVDESNLLEGAMRTRDIVVKARGMLEAGDMDDCTLGAILNRQQKVLHEKLKISTSKLDRMIDAAVNAGALGAKINGSGEGGCMFAYAPDCPNRVAQAIEDVGGKAYVIRIDEGVRLE